ncbi:hypothetical protein HYPSUDRAFT_1096871 [Hypholoma sublateritium FD-334 SS-4]|uniref:Uncharacterized protein n=1 Tax=Hypholoma sublateritium (strain FD-334 SS-4) TaxID=945553 RepID=A0A0D2NJC1_HYPSF|nr:hypothetical protein HYPSUDRAFT_1096871 [Hypholoma sublateritium FD-334 SS-4]
MSLKSGTYTISSKFGCNPMDDMSLNPKRVVVLPQGVEASKKKLEIKAFPDDNCILKIGGGFPKQIDKLLFAVFHQQPEQAVWKIQGGKIQGLWRAQRLRGA